MSNRIFIAVNLPENVKKKLAEYEENWLDLPIRWTKKENLHITLVFLGYLLRYPTPSLVLFSDVTDLQWKIFFAVDVLQLIGFGLLFLIISMYIAEKFKISDYVIFGSAALFFFALYAVFENIKWAEFLPVPLAGYLYKGTGSNFPLFPW